MRGFASAVRAPRGTPGSRGRRGARQRRRPRGRRRTRGRLGRRRPRRRFRARAVARSRRGGCAHTLRSQSFRDSQGTRSSTNRAPAGSPRPGGQRETAAQHQSRNGSATSGASSPQRARSTGPSSAEIRGVIRSIEVETKEAFASIQPASSGATPSTQAAMPRASRPPLSGRLSHETTAIGPPPAGAGTRAPAAVGRARSPVPRPAAPAPGGDNGELVAVASHQRVVKVGAAVHAEPVADLGDGQCDNRSVPRREIGQQLGRSSPACARTMLPITSARSPSSARSTSV